MEQISELTRINGFLLDFWFEQANLGWCIVGVAILAVCQGVAVFRLHIGIGLEGLGHHPVIQYRVKYAVQPVMVHISFQVKIQARVLPGEKKTEAEQTGLQEFEMLQSVEFEAGTLVNASALFVSVASFNGDHFSGDHFNGDHFNS